MFEVPPALLLHDSGGSGGGGENNRSELKAGLMKLLRHHEARNDVKKRVAVRYLRLPAHVAATVPRTTTSMGVVMALSAAEEHADFVHRGLFGSKKQRSVGKVVEVRVGSNSGGLARWHSARVLRVSPAEHLKEAAANLNKPKKQAESSSSSHEGGSEDGAYSDEYSAESENALTSSNNNNPTPLPPGTVDDGKAEAKANRKTKKMVKKKKSQATHKKQGAAPKYYDVEFFRESRESRLEATVDAILRKCSKMVRLFSCSQCIFVSLTTTTDTDATRASLSRK